MPQANPNNASKPKKTASAVRFVLFALLGLAGTTLILLAPHLLGESLVIRQGWTVVTFLLDFLLVATVVFGFGYAVTGDMMGITLSSWNDYSLSKLQMALWTIVVLSALLVFVKLRLLAIFPYCPGAVTDPLEITIPGDLLAAMGIAAFTTAATPAILALKSSQVPPDAELSGAQQRVARTGAGDAGDITATGKVVGRASQASASWLDLVMGDETSNAGIVDLSKVQQLLITILLLGTYIGALIDKFAHLQTSDELGSLPPLSSYFVGLMAISHAGYLAYKATPKSGQADAGAAAAAQTPAPALNTPVPIRLAVADAQNVAGLQLMVDLRPVPVSATGFAELQLDGGVAHSIVARGVRAGKAVIGTLVITPTPNDADRPVELQLS